MRAKNSTSENSFFAEDMGKTTYMLEWFKTKLI